MVNTSLQKSIGSHIVIVNYDQLLESKYLQGGKPVT